MKITPIKGLMAFLCLSLFILNSCNKDENTTKDDVNFSSEDSARAAKTDNVAEGTFNIMEQAFVENETQGKGGTVSSLFPECTVITVGSQGNIITVLLDFGASCTLNNGDIVSGKILLEYGPLVAGTYTINYTFEDFVFNGNGVGGGGVILYEIANANGNPQSTINESITISFPNNSVTGTRNGLRISEWVEGVGSGTWLDNVYHITGNWQTEFTNGFERTGEVTEALVYETNCALFGGR